MTERNTDSGFCHCVDFSETGSFPQAILLLFIVHYYYICLLVVYDSRDIAPHIILNYLKLFPNRLFILYKIENRKPFFLVSIIYFFRYFIFICDLTTVRLSTLP